MVFLISGYPLYSKTIIFFIVRDITSQNNVTVDVNKGTIHRDMALTPAIRPKMKKI